MKRISLTRLEWVAAVVAIIVVLVPLVPYALAH